MRAWRFVGEPDLSAIVTPIQPKEVQRQRISLARSSIEPFKPLPRHLYEFLSLTPVLADIKNRSLRGRYVRQRFGR
jgi:hypothetical protein